MTPEQIANIILLVLTGLLGVGSGSAITRARKTAAERSYKELFTETAGELADVKKTAHETAAELAEAKIKLLEQATFITTLEARLTLYESEREKERKRADGYMENQGYLKAQMEQMRSELDTLKRELHEAQAKNAELHEANNKLENYRELAHELKRQHDDTKRLLDDAQAVIKRQEREAEAFKDQIRILRSRLNPEPPPADAVDPKTGTEAA